MAFNVWMQYQVLQAPAGTSLETQLNEQAKMGWKMEAILPKTDGYEVVYSQFEMVMPSWVAAEPEMG